VAAASKQHLRYIHSCVIRWDYGTQTTNHINNHHQNIDNITRHAPPNSAHGTRETQPDTIHIVWTYTQRKRERRCALVRRSVFSRLVSLIITRSHPASNAGLKCDDDVVQNRLLIHLSSNQERPIIEARTGAGACVGWYRGSRWRLVECFPCRQHTWSVGSSSAGRLISLFSAKCFNKKVTKRHVQCNRSKTNQTAELH